MTTSTSTLSRANQQQSLSLQLHELEQKAAEELRHDTTVSAVERLVDQSGIALDQQTIKQLSLAEKILTRFIAEDDLINRRKNLVAYKGGEFATLLKNQLGENYHTWLLLHVGESRYNATKTRLENYQALFFAIEFGAGVENCSALEYLERHSEVANTIWYKLGSRNQPLEIIAAATNLIKIGFKPPTVEELQLAQATLEQIKGDDALSEQEKRSKINELLKFRRTRENTRKINFEDDGAIDLTVDVEFETADFSDDNLSNPSAETVEEKTSLESLKANLKKYILRINQLRAENQSLKAENQEIKAENAKLKEEVDFLEESNSFLRTEETGRGGRIQALEEELQVLRAQLARYTESASEPQTHMPTVATSDGFEEAKFEEIRRKPVSQVRAQVENSGTGIVELEEIADAFGIQIRDSQGNISRSKDWVRQVILDQLPESFDESFSS